MNHLPIRYSSIACLFCLLLLGCIGDNDGQSIPQSEKPTSSKKGGGSQKSGGGSKTQANNAMGGTGGGSTSSTSGTPAGPKPAPAGNNTPKNTSGSNTPTAGDVKAANALVMTAECAKTLHGALNSIVRKLSSTKTTPSKKSPSKKKTTQTLKKFWKANYDKLVKPTFNKQPRWETEQLAALGVINGLMKAIIANAEVKGQNAKLLGAIDTIIKAVDNAKKVKVGKKQEHPFIKQDLAQGATNNSTSRLSPDSWEKLKDCFEAIKKELHSQSAANSTP